MFSEEEGTGLAARVRALPALDAAALETAIGDVLVDAWVPGAPLLITFVVVATGNHYFTDVFLGALTAGVSALLAKQLLARARPDAWAFRQATA